MKIKWLIVILFFFFLNNYILEAQVLETGQITGFVVDSLTKAEMPFSSVNIEQGEKNIVGLQTSKNGSFVFKKIPFGQYIIKVQYLGYNTFTKKIVINKPEVVIDSIKLILTQVNLSEVKVIGKKPFIEHSIDKMILNVSESITGAGGFATDLLRRVPGMIVNNDGLLMFRGRKVTQVMIDGKLISLSVDEIGKVLENMPSGSIDKIEVITNPSAKYDAEGRGAGIVNIKTIKGKAWGTNGNFNVSIGAGEQYRYTTGIDLNHRAEKINLFGSYNRVDNQQYIIVNTQSIREKTLFSESNRLNTHRFNNNLRLGVDYQIGKKSTIGLLLTGFSNQSPANANATIDFINSPKTTDSTLNSFMKREVQWNNGAINLNYVKNIDSTGKVLKFDIDYLDNDNRTVESFEIKRSYPNNSNNFYSYFRNNLPLKVEIVSINIDYVNPIREGHELSIGIKSRMTWLLNDTRFETPLNDIWQTDFTRTNLFKFQENVNAVYINYKTVFKKTNLIIGLRGEHTAIEGNSITKQETFTQNYFQLFPNITLQRKYGENHEVKISYQKSIGRPSYNQFNPFLTYYDNYNLSKGNPNLRPEIYHSIDLTYSHKDELFLGGGININDGSIARMARQTGKVLAYVFENFGYGEDYYLYIDYTKNPIKWWQTNNSVGVYYQRIKGDYDNQAYQYQTPYYAFYSTNTFTIGKGYSLELSGNYKSEGLFSIYAIKGFVTFNSGISKSVLNNKGSLKLSITDIFNGLKSGWDVEFSNLNLSARRKDETRFIRLNFTYRFGNTNVKKNRSRQTGLNEDSQRLGSQN
ncbi:MAG: TonB-dependent receptor [Arcicella sp.]|nr:TonB-dependent receptor [Arcicella sp.]